MVRKEINKYALIDVIEYELEWREKAHQIKLEEKNKEIIKQNKENARLKAILQKNGIAY